MELWIVNGNEVIINVEKINYVEKTDRYTRIYFDNDLILDLPAKAFEKIKSRLVQRQLVID